jgi:hypothetical protein
MIPAGETVLGKIGKAALGQGRRGYDIMPDGPSPAAWRTDDTENPD